MPYLPGKGGCWYYFRSRCPGIADPGAELVALAHQHQYPVVPLVGPSSILLALISSGFNGKISLLTVICQLKTMNVAAH